MPQSHQLEPVSDAEAAALFADLTRFGLVALAVSGGPDSLALLHLFARWRAQLAEPPATLVLSVDHGLRPASAGEADFVAREAAGLGLLHDTLVWGGPKPATGLPNAAREARYRLMTERLARETRAPIALLTAHTQDDQAETLLMRLARGSGVEGLAGMSRERSLSKDYGITLVRPLLAVPKARLEATLDALGGTWIVDPTNSDPAYERPRLRQSQVLRDEAGLTNAALALSATRLVRANVALEVTTCALEACAVVHVPGILAAIYRAAFDVAPSEIQIRLLARLLAAYGGEHPVAQLSEIERLAARLAAPDAAAMTLGGCLITPKADSILIHREAGRGLPVLDLAPGQSAVWDARFMVSLDASAPGPCSVRALSAAEWNVLAVKSACISRAREALTVPSFWHAGGLVAVPQLRALRGEPTLERQLHWLASADVLAVFEPACVARPAAIKTVQ